MKYTYKEYQKLLKLSLEKKISWSNKVIQEALQDDITASVSLSWGKGSVVLTDLVTKQCSGVYVIFANTGVEYPETYEYRDEMLKGYFKNIQYLETKPIKTFWECVKQYGYPTLRGKGSSNTPKCCTYLKEKPLDNAEKELGINRSFIGLQAIESMNRRLVFLRVGELHKTKCYPIMIWTDEDIWEYAKQNNIPMNPIYNTMKRNGCMFCTGFKKWKEVMASYNPSMYAQILNMKNGQQILKDCFKSK